MAIAESEQDQQNRENKQELIKRGLSSNQGKNVYEGVKTTLFTDPSTLQKYPIPVNMSPNPTVRRILTYLDRTGFLGILNIGMSGTGKSTWSRMLVHLLHQNRNFVIHWYSRDDIAKMDREIKSLEKGLNHIMIFDDASFALEKLKKEDVNRIAQQLTYVRHDVKGQVIVIMNIHYSKAISRFFRNVPFVFLTSITMEEVHTFQDVWPHGRYKFRDFAWYYQQMMFNNEWIFEVDRWTGKKIKYDTDKPFRLGLAMEGNGLHFFVYLKSSCHICDPDFNAKRIMNSQELVDHFVDAYGKDRARAMIRLYSFARHGMKVIDSKRLAIWHTLAEFDRSNSINWKNVNKILDKNLTRKRSRTYIKKKEYKDKVEHAEEVISDEPDPTTLEEFSREVEEAFEQIDTDKKEIKKDKVQIADDGFNYNDPEDPIDMPYGFENVDPSLDNPTGGDTGGDNDQF